LHPIGWLMGCNRPSGQAESMKKTRDMARDLTRHLSETLGREAVPLIDPMLELNCTHRRVNRTTCGAIHKCR